MSVVHAPLATARVLADVADERLRQHGLRGDQSHLPDGTEDSRISRARLQVARLQYELGESTDNLTHADIVGEEYAECLAETDRRKLRVELVQLAASVVQWAEAIDATLDPLEDGGGGDGE